MELFDFCKYKNNIALVCDTGEKMTYGQLQEEVDILKNKLSKRGMAFCFCTNSMPAVIGYVGLIQAHIPTLLLDVEKDTDLVQHLIDIYHPMYLWKPASDNIPEEVIYQNGNYVLYKCHDEDIPLHPNLSLLLTTSGSTGSPKLVRITEENLASNAESIIEYLRITEKERAITSLPMYYSFGMSVINSHLHAGASLILTNDSILQPTFWKLAKEEKATSLAGVPYTFEMLRRLRLFRMDLPDLKTLIQAGGKLNAKFVKEYVEQAQAHDKEFIVMYGQTEAAPRMSYLPFEKALEKFSSIGIAIPGGEFSIIDTNGEIITEPNVDGELVYKGANVCMGYAEDLEDLAKGDENGGILHTGDIAHFDSDGYYYITGRMKRFVKIWGNRCNLDSIEQLLKGVATNCACIGVDDKITVFITDDGKEQDIAAYLSQMTGLNSMAFKVKVIEDMPKKDTGKIDYHSLEAIAD